MTGSFDGYRCRESAVSQVADIVTGYSKGTVAVKRWSKQADGVGGNMVGMQYQATCLFCVVAFRALGKSDMKSLGCIGYAEALKACMGACRGPKGLHGGI
jgi:hypothetical protein